MIIAIDGPAGSGKSTLAKELSKRLGVPYLETGLLYRAVGYLCLKGKSRCDDVESTVKSLDVLEVKVDVEGTRVFYEGNDISGKLNDERVGKLASQVATIPEFREKINDLFRNLVKGKSAVVEGRDAGTHIFPNAELKFFITASPEERARRRYNQLLKAGKEADYREILNAIVERDKRDSSRAKYPFRPAPDAIVIDTTGREVEEVLREVMERINELHS